MAAWEDLPSTRSGYITAKESCRPVDLRAVTTSKTCAVFVSRKSLSNGWRTRNGVCLRWSTVRLDIGNITTSGNVASDGERDVHSFQN